MMKKLLLLGIGTGILFQASAQDLTRISSNLKDGDKQSSQSVVKVKPKSSNKTSALNVEPITIGSAVNAFTQVGHNRKRVSSSDDINTVLFIHRGDAAVSGQSGNIVVYDYSTDGGATWTSNAGPVIPNNYSPGNRYPQGGIYNPLGNTDPANARVVTLAPQGTGTNNGWGGLASGTSKLDGTSQSDQDITRSAAFIPQSFTERIPGEYWATDDTTLNGMITLYKGVYDAGTDRVNWTVGATLGKSLDVFPAGPTNADLNIAFSPDGTIGWCGMLGDLASKPVLDSTLNPVFWKSTDGGATWSAPQTVALADYPEVVDNVGGFKPTTGFDIAFSVDYLGNPHLFCVVGPGASTAYSIGSGGTLPLYDITQVNGNWVANWVDTIESFRGSSFGTLTHDNEPMISMSEDGKRIFYMWTDTRLEVQNPGDSQPNDFPDLYVKGYDIENDVWTKKINAVEGASVEGLVYLPAASQTASKNGSDYSLHVVIVSPTVDENVQVNFVYLDGIDIPESEFTGVSNTKNTLFDITGNYPNPFTGSTKVDINLTKASTVKVSISNLLGQVVSQAASLELEAGKQTISIDGSSLSSGIYLYTVEAGGFTVTKKMIVE